MIDIRFLSIYANDLVEDQNKRVQHGVIREVSLVMSGANPGARIDNLAFAHGEGEEESLIHDEVIIYTGENLETVEMANKIVHAAPAQAVAHREVALRLQPRAGFELARQYLRLYLLYEALAL